MAAFRFLPSVVAPAAAAVVLLAPYIGVGLGNPDIVPSFVAGLAFLAGLTWATRRIWPLAVALWLGAMCGLLANEFIRRFVFHDLAWDETEGVWLSLLGPILFASCFVTAIWFMTAQRRGPRSDGGSIRRDGRSRESWGFL